MLEISGRAARLRSTHRGPGVPRIDIAAFDNERVAASGHVPGHGAVEDTNCYHAGCLGGV